MITRELTGKINANGRLFIERKGELKPQECNYRERTCGDFCPHFGEPRSTDNSKDPEDDAKTELFICGGSVLIFDKLDDQRGRVMAHPFQVQRALANQIPSVMPELVESLRRTGA